MPRLALARHPQRRVVRRRRLRKHEAVLGKYAPLTEMRGGSDVVLNDASGQILFVLHVCYVPQRKNLNILHPGEDLLVQIQQLKQRKMSITEIHLCVWFCTRSIFSHPVSIEKNIETISLPRVVFSE